MFYLEKNDLVVFELTKDLGAIKKALLTLTSHMPDEERKSLETQLREAQKMESLGTLAGGIAHDFNNVLGAIIGHLALAREQLPTDHAARQHLDQIGRSSTRARELVQQILAFSRRQPQSKLDQPLRPLVEEALTLLRATLPARVRLSTVLDDTPVWVRADGTQIHQVLMNLCTNDWHALEDAAGDIEVGLGTADAPPASTCLLPGSCWRGRARIRNRSPDAAKRNPGPLNPRMHRRGFR